MSKLNLFGKDWNNLVFEGRNKLYGAYKLRQESTKITFLSLLIGVGILSLLFGSSYLYASKPAESAVIEEYPTKEIEPTIVEFKKDEPEKIPEPVVEEDIAKSDEPAAQARTHVQENIKLIEAVVAPDEEVTEQMNAQSDFTDDIQSGITNTPPDPDGVLNTDGGRPGEGLEGPDGINPNPSEGEGTSVINDIVTIVQKKAMPNGGFQKFYDGFKRKFSAGNVSNNVTEIEIRLRFVVEKDGSLTDIKILDDKQGLGSEAIRVLKSMPNWQPAQHNGQTVRSMFTLPIKIRVNN